MLGPKLANAPAERKLRVKLELPDGTTRETNAEVETAHIRGPNGAFGLLRLPDLAPEDVPLGTKVWRLTSE